MSVFGWRFWVAAAGVNYDGRHCPALLGSPFQSARVESEEEDLLGGPTLPPARCWTSTHDAPATDCMCGHRIVDDLASVVAYARRTLPTMRNVAFVRCEATGDVLPGVPDVDPPGTWRSTGLRLVGPMHLSPSQAKHHRIFASTFKLRVVPGHADYERWLDAISS